MGPEAGKPVRRSATADRLPEALGQPGVSGRAEAPPKSATATANAKVLMPALRSAGQLAWAPSTSWSKRCWLPSRSALPPALGACSPCFAQHTWPSQPLCVAVIIGAPAWLRDADKVKTLSKLCRHSSCCVVAAIPLCSLTARFPEALASSKRRYTCAQACSLADEY